MNKKNFSATFPSKLLTEMSSFKVKHAFKGSISDEYAYVNIHVRDGDNQNIVIKSNKVVLAFYSKYFHEVLKHRANSPCVDFAFLGVQATVILISCMVERSQFQLKNVENSKNFSNCCTSIL